MSAGTQTDEVESQVGCAYRLDDDDQGFDRRRGIVVGRALEVRRGETDRGRPARGPLVDELRVAVARLDELICLGPLLEALRLNPYDTSVFLRKARILIHLGQTAEARELLEEQRRQDRRNFKINLVLGDVYIAQKDWERAYWILGKVNPEQREYRSARKRLERVLPEYRRMKGIPPKSPSHPLTPEPGSEHDDRP